MSHRLAASSFVTCMLSSLAVALAQDAPGAQGAPVPAGPLARYSFGAVPELAKMLPNTAFGRLLADEEVAPVVQQTIAWFERQVHDRLALHNAVLEHDVEIEPYYLTALVPDGSLFDLGRFPLTELQRIDVMAFLSADQDFPLPSTRISARCRPQFDGRWLAAFDASVQRLAKSRYFRREDAAKVDGFPAELFRVQGVESNDYPFRLQDPWQVHLPGVYVFGTGRLPERLDELSPPPPALAGLQLEVDLQQYISLFSRGGMMMPVPLQAIGFNNLRHFTWQLSFSGERVLEELALTCEGDPDGLIGALLGGTAALPVQPLPEGALAQLRVAIDAAALCQRVQELLAGEFELPEQVVADVGKALSGGLALGVAAPATGGVIPRVFASLGIADREAFDRLMKFAAEQGLPMKDVEYEGVACHRLELPGMPNGLQITFAVVGDTLHLAESGRSLRTLLQSLADGGQAMQVGDAPTPEGAGELLGTCDLRFDELAIYKSYRDVWLPLYALAPHDADWSQPVSRDDLPDVETLANHLGTGRGVLRRDGNRFVLQQSGTFGGLPALALALLWPTMIAGENIDWTQRQLSSQLAKHQLAAAWQALEAFRKREQRWPASLAELFVTQKLGDDALLMPDDPMSEELALPDGRKVRTSFRYFAEPITAGHQGEGKVLLIEIRPRSYNRAMLTVDGDLPDVYGDSSSRTIDKFGK